MLIRLNVIISMCDGVETRRLAQYKLYSRLVLLEARAKKSTPVFVVHIFEIDPSYKICLSLTFFSADPGLNARFNVLVCTVTQKNPRKLQHFQIKRHC